MNKYFLLPLFLLFAGCSHLTHIVTVNIVEANDESIILAVVTNEDILKYDASHWAYEVHLTYSVNGNKYYNSIGTSSPIDDMPFLAKRISEKSTPLKHGWFETTWSIQSENAISSSGRTYFYKLSSKKINLIDIAIAGGTMHLTGIKSNHYVVSYSNAK